MGNYGYPGPLLLSPGRAIGLRMIPMERDLRFAWEETPQQLFDEQAQKVREGPPRDAHRLGSASGEGSDYRDNIRCSACIRWGIGTRFRTCCGTAC